MTITTYANTHSQASCLIPLDSKDSVHVKVKALFEAGWLHSDSALYSVNSIFKIQLPDASMKPYQTYLNRVRDEVGPWRAGQVEQLLFHGTKRSCDLGEGSGNVNPCSSPACSLCGIVKNSFDVSLCGSRTRFSRFGNGVYVSSCSSKAAGYALNADNQLQSQVLLVSSVVVGNAYKTTRTSTKIDGPPRGSHSVLGVPGEDLNFEETVVYKNDAIRPAYLVTFSGSSDARTCPSIDALWSAIDSFTRALDGVNCHFSGSSLQVQNPPSLGWSNSIDSLAVALQLLDCEGEDFLDDDGYGYDESDDGDVYYEADLVYDEEDDVVYGYASSF